MRFGSKRRGPNSPLLKRAWASSAVSRAEGGQGFLAEAGEAVLGDGGANLPGEAVHVGEVVDRGQDRAEHLVGQEQVADRAPVVVGAGVAIAARLDRGCVGLVDGVAQLDGADGRQATGVAAVAGRQDTVEDVDAGGDGVDEVPRTADTHQIADLAGRQKVRRHVERRADLLAALTDADAPDGVAVEPDLDEASGALGAEVRVDCPPGRSRRGPDRADCGRPGSVAPSE